MADNVSILDGSAASFNASADELGDGSKSPKVSILDGTGSATPIDVRQGNVAHDGSDSGNPVKVGFKAVAHGSNPTAVAAGDRTDSYANRHGILFTIGGHPNVITRSAQVSDADGAQTDASIVGTINSGTKVVVTRLSIFTDNANTGDTSVKVGFGASTLPASSETGANGILFEGSLDANSGINIGDGSGILGIGGDGEEFRLTCGDPAGGNLTVAFSYFTIES
jgi:hypothetical protein